MRPTMAPQLQGRHEPSLKGSGFAARAFRHQVGIPPLHKQLARAAMGQKLAATDNTAAGPPI